MLELRDMYAVVAGYKLLKESEKSMIPYFMNKKAMATAIECADMLNRQGLIPELYFRIKEKLV